MEHVNKKLFYAISLLVFGSGLFSVIDDLISGYTPFIIGIDLVILSVGAIYYSLARWVLPIKTLIPYFLVTIVLITLSGWFFLGGVYGPAAPGLISTFTVAIILVPNDQTKLVTTLVSLILVAICIYQFLAPPFLVNGEPIVTSFPEVVIDYIPLALATVLLVAFLKIQVNKERTQKEKHNKSLIELNEELKTVVARQNETLLKLQSTQARLIETERMATLGRVTAELAHELNNPINFIGGSIIPIEQHLKDIKDEYPGSVENEHFKEIEELLKNVRDGASRTTAIVKNLMTVSPKIGQESYDVELDEILETNFSIITREYSNLKIKLEGPSRFTLGFSAEEQHQIIQNSIQSVIDANYHDQNVDFTILVATRKSRNKVSMSIEPLGLEVLSDKDNFTTEMPLEDVINSNLGLFVAKSLVYKNGGEMNFRGTGQKGFAVSIEFSLDSN